MPAHERRKARQGEALAFAEKAISSDTDDCILWPFSLTRNSPERGGGEGRNYGELRVKGRTTRAHRYVCERVHGPAPAGHEAAHQCGKQACINPGHLRWATRAENQADRVAHGTSNRGERQWNSRLTETQVLEIKMELHGAKWGTQGKLANRYGVGRKTISDIATGKTWSWVIAGPQLELDLGVYSRAA